MDFVIDGFGISHCIGVDDWETWCGRFIQHHWEDDEAPPLVCGPCVIAWSNNETQGRTNG